MARRQLPSLQLARNLGTRTQFLQVWGCSGATILRGTPNGATAYLPMVGKDSLGAICGPGSFPPNQG